MNDARHDWNPQGSATTEHAAQAGASRRRTIAALAAGALAGTRRVGPLVVAAVVPLRPAGARPGSPEAGDAAAAAAGKAAAGRRLLTPPQSLGPFYPVDWAGDDDNDLVVVKGEAARALGTVAHVRGRVVDRHGDALPGSTVEIWQCDANGVYRHPRDRQQVRRDPAFQGRGRVRAAADGSWAFRTIRPAPYPGRTPHIHFLVRTPAGRELVTQLYVAGEPGNARDRLLNSIRDERLRDRLIARFEPADRIEPKALLANFEIVIG